jgi:hypothetical protein
MACTDGSPPFRIIPVCVRSKSIWQGYFDDMTALFAHAIETRKLVTTMRPTITHLWQRPYHAVDRRLA